VAYRFTLARDFVRALEVADEAITLLPNNVWLYVNRAHALMLLDRVDEARSLYLRHCGEKHLRSGKAWEAIVLDDPAELRKAGLMHPLMDEIEATFTTRDRISSSVSVTSSPILRSLCVARLAAPKSRSPQG
jgi:hypothetical protein